MTLPRLRDPVVSFVSQRAFEEWLELHHEASPGAWLKIAKKGAAEPTISYAEAVEAALMFGWIDGQKDRLDDDYWLQRFTPRTRRSPWSKVNREKAERLLETGRLRPAGLAAVEQARADGRWASAYAGAASATVPDELQREFDRDPELAAAFAASDARTRYSIIWRIDDAKRPETRARRVERYIGLLRRGERIER